MADPSKEIQLCMLKIRPHASIETKERPFLPLRGGTEFFAHAAFFAPRAHAAAQPNRANHGGLTRMRDNGPRKMEKEHELNLTQTPD